ncbi:hypothetical protein Q9L42_000250 (plasmid) [Methylomarinum sp. Ch1-1]|uniref:Uncharacterized protein n=1 Tax=Methylomarinum roseum TaxID=3067653 RepID=A0AAU7NP63_9GAMM|nr:hypothetical protein [Methylomarinum sp. Ch1-1]MDP4523072.1 hypothetical protein [Methylomarinum sp. Ch1-1]
MHELSTPELYKALEYAKSVDEETGKSILDQFQIDQPALAQAIFAIFPNFVAEQDQDMAYLFMDLCFDVICVFQHAFGETPKQNELSGEWMEKQAALLDAELQSLIAEKTMDPKMRAKLQERFSQRAADEVTQTGLVKFMNDAIDDFASESPSRVPAIKITQTMIFVVIRLFSNLYSTAAKK